MGLSLLFIEPLVVAIWTPKSRVAPFSPSTLLKPGTLEPSDQKANVGPHPSAICESIEGQHLGLGDEGHPGDARPRAEELRAVPGLLASIHDGDAKLCNRAARKMPVRIPERQVCLLKTKRLKEYHEGRTTHRIQ